MRVCSLQSGDWRRYMRASHIYAYTHSADEQLRNLSSDRRRGEEKDLQRSRLGAFSSDDELNC